MSIMIIFIYLPIKEMVFWTMYIQWIIYLLPLYMNCCFMNNHQQLLLITRVNVYAYSKFIQTSFAIVQMVIETSGSMISVQGSNSTCTYIRIWIKDLIYTRITSTYIFIKSNAISKFQVDRLYHFFPLTTRKFWRYGLMINVFRTFSYLGI